MTTTPYKSWIWQFLQAQDATTFHKQYASTVAVSMSCTSQDAFTAYSDEETETFYVLLAYIIDNEPVARDQASSQPEMYNVPVFSPGHLFMYYPFTRRPNVSAAQARASACGRSSPVAAACWAGMDSAPLGPVQASRE